MAEHQVLFCPFCRESFERAASLGPADASVDARCPEHELSLVSFEKLPPDPTAVDDELELEQAREAALPSDDRTLGALDPRFGRGPVAVGALLNLVALGLPLLGDTQALPLYRLARLVPSLWTLLLVSFTVLFVLARRRSLRRLRGLRVLVPLLALLSPLTLVWSVMRLIGLTGMVDFRLGAAAYAVVGASLLLLIGGARLGGRAGPAPTSLAHDSPVGG